MPQHVFRFAPSPNGWLHAGHALSALTGFRMARRHGGRFLLRIENIDTARTRPEYVAAIEEDLGWLGIAWDGPIVRQQDRFPRYASAAQRLQDMGLLYRCFATRGEIAAATGPNSPVDPDGTPLYPGLHRSLSADDIARRLSEGQPHAWRIDIARAVEIATRPMPDGLSFTECTADGHRRRVPVDPRVWGDAVIIRKDTPASYHLAVVVDDADQSVTWVTRGMDLFAATSVHRLLQTLFAWPEPLYHHHPLLSAPDGRKLSKSAGDVSLRALRRDGLSASDLIAALEAVSPQLRALA
jgi:glutamyl-Q tRNA(Asp) synthetase